MTSDRQWKWILYVLAVIALGLACPRTSRADFALRDGDTVVFLGDSITAARTYGKIVENYTLLRFPDRKVHFVNAGWGGDTAAGGLKRLERDVFRRGATVLIVAYGINDIGWGTKADAEHKRIYLDAIRGIVEQCKARGVRVFIGSAAVTAENPDTAEHGFLQTMCDEGMALARSLGEHSIDIAAHHALIHRKVLATNATSKPGDKSTLHAADGIHLSDLGQLAMAFAIIKGLGAPAEVSAASVDADGPKVISAEGCRVTNLKSCDGARVRPARPRPAGQFRAVRGLAVSLCADTRRAESVHADGREPRAGRYDVIVDGRPLGTFEREATVGRPEHRLGDRRRLGARRPLGRGGQRLDLDDRCTRPDRQRRAAPRSLPARSARPDRVTPAVARDQHANRGPAARRSSSRGHFTSWCGERSRNRGGREIHRVGSTRAFCPSDVSAIRARVRRPPGRRGSRWQTPRCACVRYRACHAGCRKPSRAPSPSLSRPRPGRCLVL